MGKTKKLAKLLSAAALGLLVFSQASLEAQLAPGSAAITIAQAPLVVNGRPSITLDAGHTVTVLGLQSSTGQAVVSYQPASGPKQVGLFPLANLVAIDQPASTPAPANPIQRTTATQPTAPPPTATAPASLDLEKKVAAHELASYFKNSKDAARAQCEGQRIKVSGTIDKVDLITGNGGVEQPVIVLKTATGLPRVKVVLANNLASNDSYFRRFGDYLPSWWWGYSNRNIDFRLNGLRELQGRAVYQATYTTRWSDGTSTVSRSKSNSQWFTFFSVGDPVSVEGTCKGLYMDVEFEGGTMLVD